MSMISDFSQIPLQPDTLYVLDFDETVVYYDGINREWWQQQFKHYYTQHEDYNRAEQQSLHEWIDHINFLSPQHVDQKGFHGIIDHCEGEPGSHVIILTARNITLSDVTEAHLDILSPDKKLDIVFCDGEHKGIKLEEYLKEHRQQYKHIVFVDDLQANICDFQETHTEARCFHMRTPSSVL